MLLLCMQLATNERGISLPWDRVVEHLHNLGIPATEGAIVQHLSKVRSRLQAVGQPVPPPLRRGGVSNVGVPSNKGRNGRPKVLISPTRQHATRVTKRKQKPKPAKKSRGSSILDDDEQSSVATAQDDDSEAEYLPKAKAKNSCLLEEAHQAIPKSASFIKKENASDEGGSANGQVDRTAKKAAHLSSTKARTLHAVGNGMLDLMAEPHTIINHDESRRLLPSLVWTIQYSKLPKINAVLKGAKRAATKQITYIDDGYFTDAPTPNSNADPKENASPSGQPMNAFSAADVTGNSGSISHVGQNANVLQSSSTINPDSSFSISENRTDPHLPASAFHYTGSTSQDGYFTGAPSPAYVATPDSNFSLPGYSTYAPSPAYVATPDSNVSHPGYSTDIAGPISALSNEGLVGLAYPPGTINPHDFDMFGLNNASHIPPQAWTQPMENPQHSSAIADYNFATPSTEVFSTPDQPFYAGTAAGDSFGMGDTIEAHGLSSSTAHASEPFAQDANDFLENVDPHDVLYDNGIDFGDDNFGEPSLTPSIASLMVRDMLIWIFTDLNGQIP